MRVFATRSASNENGNVTENGKRQIAALAKRLRDMGFGGKILAAPYAASLRTAELLSEELRADAAVFFELYDVLKNEAAVNSFVGITLEKIKEEYPRVTIPVGATYPWWDKKCEKWLDIPSRLKAPLDAVCDALTPDSDILLVGEECALIAIRELYHPTSYKSGSLWNCALSMYDTESGENFALDASHIPEDIRTYGRYTYSECREELCRSIRDGVRFFNENGGTRLLHIGDTESAHYPIYKRLIEELHPDIIVHTGDLADSFKAGRVPEDREAWRRCVPEILDIMLSSGVRVVIVAGNNDLEDELKSLAPTAEVLPKNAVLEISGRRICLSHEAFYIDPEIDADIYLYGHGLNGETRTPCDNIRGTRRYFNSTWGISLHALDANKDLLLPTIKL